MDAIRKRLKSLPNFSRNVIIKRYKLIGEDLAIYDLAMLYQKFYREVKKNKFYLVFPDKKKSPKLDKKRWNNLEKLFRALMERGINPKCYIFYHFRYNKYKMAYTLSYIWQEISFCKYLDWVAELKTQSSLPEDMVFITTDERKENKFRFYDELVLKRKKEQGLYTEYEFWKRASLPDTYEFSIEYLKQNKVFIRTVKEGYHMKDEVFNR